MVLPVHSQEMSARKTICHDERLDRVEVEAATVHTRASITSAPRLLPSLQQEIMLIEMKERGIGRMMTSV